MNLENQAMLLVAFLMIHNLRTKIFSGKHFLQNASQEYFKKKKIFSERSNDKTFQET